MINFMTILWLHYEKINLLILDIMYMAIKNTYIDVNTCIFKWKTK